MSSQGCSWARAVLLCLGVSFFCPAQDNDLAALRTLAEHLDDAYAKKDAAAVLGLWSEKAAQFPKLHDQIPKLLASVANIREKIAGSPTVTGDHARFRANREVTQKGAGAGNAKSMVLTIECVKEPGGWKIWKEEYAVQNVADQLMAAPSELEQQNLLSQNGDLPRSEVALAVLDIGHDALVHGKMQQAMAAFQVALAITANTDAGSAHARALNDIGLTHYNQGDLQEAMAWYRKSLAYSESIHDDRAAARALNNSGNVYKDEGEFALANECYEKSLALGDKLHDDASIFNAVGNLGVLNLERGDYTQALSYLKRAIDLAERIGNKRAMALTWINMGQIYERQGDYAQAAAYTQRALDAATEADDRQKMGVAWLNLGTEDQFKGDLDGALAKLEKGLAIFQALGDKMHASADLTEMGAVHMARKEYPQAIELFQKSLLIQEEIGARNERAATLNDLAAANNSMGNYATALQFAMRGEQTAENGVQIQAVWRAHLQAGSAYRSLGQMDRAEAEYARAISVIEDIRLHVAGGESEQAGFFANRLEPYRRMMELLVSAGRNDEAFAFAERAKARVLVDILRTGRVQLDGVLTVQERRRDQELRTKLASLNIRLTRERAESAQAGTPSTAQSELQNARLEYAAFQTSLYAAHTEIKTQRGEMDPIRVEEAQRLISADSAFVEFAVTDDRLFVFVSSGAASEGRTPKVQVFVQRIEREKLGELVEEFRRQLANRDLRFRATAGRVYDLVFGRAGESLRGKNKLIVIPDDVLWNLPFQALVSPSGRYLLEDYSISYAPSLTALQAMIRVKQQRRREPGEATLLAMGNPAGASAGEGPAAGKGSQTGGLPQTEKEVRELGQIYGGSQSHVYVGREATESRFKAEAGGADILHLATHGVLNDASPLYSYVSLAAEDGRSEDGLLEATELLQMQLRAELVVLSACETARGRFGAGEGMIGLSWALFVSGVPSTVLSQWRVDSESTTRLMTGFHRNRQHHMGDAQALRLAALAVRKYPAYEHPFYWAPFIMLGAGM